MTGSLAVGGDLAYPEVHGHQCECDETEACRARQAFLSRVLSQAQSCAGCGAPVHADIAERLARLAYYPYPAAPAFRCPACQQASVVTSTPTAMAEQE